MQPVNDISGKSALAAASGAFGERRLVAGQIVIDGTFLEAFRDERDRHLYRPAPTARVGRMAGSARISPTTARELRP